MREYQRRNKENRERDDMATHDVDVGSKVIPREAPMTSLGGDQPSDIEVNGDSRDAPITSLGWETTEQRSGKEMFMTNSPGGGVVLISPERYQQYGQ
jgi:hypothetical protein